MKKYFYLFVILFSLNCFAQKEANIWYFGENAGLDFNSGTPVALTDGQLVTDEGCASISDINGNLLFYTDGTTVYNKTHQIMLNGTGLNGHYSSTNSALIIPKPDSSNIYFIFTVDAQAGINGLQYSEVNMALDNGLGGVTSNKNILLHTRSTENITAIKNPAKNGYWVVAHKWESNEFTSYEVTNLGVETEPVLSAIGDQITWHYANSQGALKISPNGRRLAIARRNSGGLGLYDFDPTTGIVSNPIDFNNNYYGIEFSPNGRILYTTKLFVGLYQFNLEAGDATDIVNSKITLTTPEQSSDAFGALQLATDGKIYLARNNSDYIDVIHSPNNVGFECNYDFNSVYLDGEKSLLGLPPFNQSYFKVDEIYFNKICYGEETEFEIDQVIDSVVWDFGDPASGVNNTSTNMVSTHIFSSPGIYEVSVTATVDNQSATESIFVTIYETPIANPIPDQIVCDLYQDGMVSYDLTNHTNDILNGQDPNLFSVTYYGGIFNYNNGVPIDFPDMVEMLTFSTENPVAVVRNINNPTCEDFIEMHFEVVEAPPVNDNVMGISSCDDSSFGTDFDGIIEVDLTVKEDEVVNYNPSPDYVFSYYLDALLTNEIMNPATYQNTNLSETIYVSVYNITHPNISCLSTTNFDLNVYENPIITPIVELKQCDDDLDGYSAFNLEEVKEKSSTNYLNEIITFHETWTDAENGFPVITNTINYINQTISVDTVWARVENSNGCFKTVEVNLIVSATQIPINFQRDFYKCDDDTDGIVSFDFSSVEVGILALLPAGQLPVITYYQNLADALAETNAILDISNYENTSSPDYQDIYVRVDSDLDNSCLGLGAHISLTIETVPVANLVAIADECDPDGDNLFEFDTSTIESTLVGGQTNVTVFYFDELGSPLPSPLPNPFQTGTQTITARVENALSQDPNGACFDETAISFSVDAAAVANPIADIIECDDDIDNQFPFDTSLIESTVLGGQTGMIVTYTDSNGTILPSPLPNPFLTGNETITVKVENPLNTICFDETTFNFIVNVRPQFELDDEDVICINESPTLDITTYNPNDVYSYTWTGPNGFSDTGASTTVSDGGVYSVIATSIEGCESFPHDIIINESELATITHDMISIVDDSDNNTISIDASQLGFGDYEYALDYEFGIYQDDPYFENVPAGIHMIYVRDKNNCGTNHLEVSVIGYPKFFTPNNDGENDTWQILGVNSAFYPNSIIHIYDRFGKIVANISPTSDGWDGYYNGKSLPSTDYWFSVQLISSDGTVTNRQGNFSLIRR